MGYCVCPLCGTLVRYAYIEEEGYYAYHCPNCDIYYDTEDELAYSDEYDEDDIDEE